MTTDQRHDEILLMIQNIMMRCGYPKDVQIYYIVSELAQSGYATPTKRTMDIMKEYYEGLK